METEKPFSDKNLLILISLPEHSHLSHLCRILEKHFKKTHLFNFIAYSRQHGIFEMERHIREIIKQNDIHLVLAFQLATDFELSVEYYASLRKLAKVVFWFFDDDMFFDSTSKYYAQAADAVITINYFPLMAYRQLEIPSICYRPIHDPSVFHPVQSAKDVDVCFVGDCTKRNRMEYINFLISCGINVQTYGHGSQNGFLPKEEDISVVCSRAKIVLSFALDKLTWPASDSDSPLLNRIRQNKWHFAQIALTRSFCLSEYSPALAMLGKVGAELDVFCDKNELLSKVRYYLAHEKERNEMADRAYETARSSFVDTIALPSLLSELHETMSRKYPVNPYANKIELSVLFKTTCVNGLTFSFFILLGEGRLLNAGRLFTRLFRYGPWPFLSGFPAGALRALTVLFHKLTGGYSRVYKK